MESILVPLGSFALTFGIIYFVLTTRHKERIKLIESGADPEFVQTEKPEGTGHQMGVSADWYWPGNFRRIYHGIFRST